MKTRAVRAAAALVILSLLFLGRGATYQSALAQARSDAPIPASSAFDAGCNGDDLSDTSDSARDDPIWAPIIHDSNYPVPDDRPTILQGTVATPDQKFGPWQERSSSQAPSEVAEEDLPWNHYTHDKTSDVIPDPGYNHLLSSWVNPDGSTGHANLLGVEWDNASLMQDNRAWGAEPEFVWSSVRDRVWVSGRWVFDCGHVGSVPAVIYDKDHNGTFSQADIVIAGYSAKLYFPTFPPLPAPWPLQPDPLLKLVDSNGNRVWDPGETLIYDTNNDGVYDDGDEAASGAPLARGTSLQTDSALAETYTSFEVGNRAYAQFSTEVHPPRGIVTLRLNHPVVGSSSLPVTGLQTKVPVTEADMFFSGNGGGANDRCSLVDRHINAVGHLLSLGILGIDDCTHTGPVIPINDRNYVFDVYPPGTNFNPTNHNPNTAWPVAPPTPDASLQWRWIDESNQIPEHACGQDKSYCVQMRPDNVKVCLVDANTPPPTDDPMDRWGQGESQCPDLNGPATHLRVILPFKGTNFNVLAQTLLLGWDDVPAPPTSSARTVVIHLHKLTVVHNGESFLHDGDWRVFADVGGQWRYLSPLFDRNSDGDNVCEGDSLTENGDGDCFQFDSSPWTVSVQDGTPIHIAVGGFESDSVDGDFCRNYSGCDPRNGAALDLAFANDDRIGTYEFDLSPPFYSPHATFTTQRLEDGEQYSVMFTVATVAFPPPPDSGPLGIGSPQYTNSGGVLYATSTTPLTLSTAYTSAVGFQYRYHHDGTPLPTYSSNPFPVHWTSTDFVAGPRSVPVFLNAYDGADGPYTLQYSAQTGNGLTEPRHIAHLTLDNTPPVITIRQPAANATYTHSQTLALTYAASEGSGSGVESVTALMNGATTTLTGQTLQSGQSISLLTGLKLGPHTFTLNAVDNVRNASSKSVTFTIIVTAESIKDDVRQFLASGKLTMRRARSLSAKLDAAARARGNCFRAANSYQAFIREVRALSGKSLDRTAASIMIADAQYLITHCP